MTSLRKIAANRRNTVSSTGPRTASGKLRSSRNALKHGLATTVALDPACVKDIEQLTKALVGETSDRLTLALGRMAAEAELGLARVRAHRISLINMEVAANCSEAVIGNSNPDAGVKRDSSSCSEALILSIDQLVSSERYERRAFSRRKRAFRDLQLRLRQNTMKISDDLAKQTQSS